MPTESPPPENPAREWLFKRDGQVFGPVPEPRLVEMLVQGELGPATEVAVEDGAWHAVREVTGFLVHLRKAEARARVEAEVTGARKLARRRSAVRLTVFAAAGALLLAAVSGVAYLLATRRPWERPSALLADFGDGIAIGAARVSGRRHAGAAAEEEILVPDRAGAEVPRSRRAPAGPTAARPAGGPVPRAGDLVLASYDPARIQQSVARQRGALAPCLREEAARSPEFSGEIPVEFAVGNEGRVVALWVDEPRFKSGPLRDCLLARLAEFTFDRFPGERPVVSLSLRIAR